MTAKTLHLRKPVCVIIPVFNAAKDLRRLIDGLDSSIAPATKNLRFLIIDDASTDPEIAAIISTHTFFSRRTVCVLNNKKNRGFVHSVNRGLRSIAGRTDVLLLNSDTRLRGSSIEIMQRVARRHRRVASVTPVTNNGFLASLFHWPFGARPPRRMSFDNVCDIIEKAKLATPLQPAPVGVGFCMYITSNALAKVGAFNEKLFGRGYGEEEDWSYRASRKGFIHLISPETYVEHAGTKSFTLKERKRQIQASQKVLRGRYGDYTKKLQNYLELDPLQRTRTEIVFRLLVARAI